MDPHPFRKIDERKLARNDWKGQFPRKTKIPFHIKKGDKTKGDLPFYFLHTSTQPRAPERGKSSSGVSRAALLELPQAG